MAAEYTLKPSKTPGCWIVDGVVPLCVKDEESADGYKIVDHPLDFECTSYGTNASGAQLDRAFKMLCNYTADPKLGKAGRRNNDAVNLCIAVHVLGFDAEEWIGNLVSEHRIAADDMMEFADHVTRVCEYLDIWGPDSDLGRALEKTI